MDEKKDCGEGYFKPDTLHADFAYWAKMAKWTEGEAAALLCRLNPDYAAKKWMFSRDLAAKYDSLLKLAIRATNDRRFGWPYTPTRWLAWAKKYDLPMPPELEAEIVKYDRAAVSAERESIVVAEKDNAPAETNLEIESKAAVAAPGKFSRMRAKTLQIADELWPDKSNIPLRTKDRNNAIINAWPNGETAPHSKTIGRAFATRTNRDK